MGPAWELFERLVLRVVFALWALTTAYIAMELVDGRPLSEHAEAARLDLRARAAGIDLVFVDAPRRPASSAPDRMAAEGRRAVEAFVTARGAHQVSLEQPELLDLRRFAGGDHYDQDGRAVFTRLTTDALAPFARRAEREHETRCDRIVDRAPAGTADTPPN